MLYAIILFETVRSYEKITSFLLSKKNPFTQIIVSLMYSSIFPQRMKLYRPSIFIVLSNGRKESCSNYHT